MPNPRVYFDMTVGEDPIGRIVFELYADATPKTAENFRALCTGEMGNCKNNPTKLLHYKGSKFHRVIKGFMCQGGDFTHGSGVGGESIYGEKFEDENFVHIHDKPYLLSMANAGPGTNGSQFFITVAPTPHLDGKHVVFGRVLKGKDLVRMIEENPVRGESSPIKEVIVANCGELQPGEDDGVPVDPNDPYPAFPADMEEAATTAQRMEIAAKIRALGNAAFTATPPNLPAAIDKYNKCLRYLEGKDSQLVAERVSPQLNLASCYLAQKKYNLAVPKAQAALEVDAKNAKAHRILGKAFSFMKSYSSAREHLRLAIENTPGGDEPSAKLLAQVNAQVRKEEKQQADAYARMFGN